MANESIPHAVAVNLKHEKYDVFIGRPSVWGNPFYLTKQTTRAAVIDRYRQWIWTQPKLLGRLQELRGKRLGCYCSPLPCHGDVLAEMANMLTDEEISTAMRLVVTEATNAE